MPELIVEPCGEGVVRLRLDRPEKRNALSLSLRVALADAIDDLVVDRSVRCLIIAGSPAAFASGGDLQEMAERSVHDVAHDSAYNGSRRLWRALRDCPKPIIAAVRGFALGGGCELMLHADLVIAGQGARIGQPEVTVGVAPGSGGIARFVRTAGRVRALRWLMTGELMPAETAERLGLVSEVVDDEAVEDRALALARRIAALPPLAVQAIKECAALAEDQPLATALALERKTFELLYTSEDRAEGVAAFLERRTPQFKGR